MYSCVALHSGHWTSCSGFSWIMLNLFHLAFPPVQTVNFHCFGFKGEMKCEPCNHLLDGAGAYRIKQYPVCSLRYTVLILCLHTIWKLLYNCSKTSFSSFSQFRMSIHTGSFYTQTHLLILLLLDVAALLPTRMLKGTYYDNAQWI